MKYTVAAVYCAINKAGEILLDPDQTNVVDCDTVFTFAFDSVDRDIVTFQSSGSFKMDQFNCAYQKCREASKTIFDFYRKSMLKFHTKTLHKLKSKITDSANNSNIETIMEVEE